MEDFHRDEPVTERIAGKEISMWWRTFLDHNTVTGKLGCIFGNYFWKKPVMVIGGVGLFLDEENIFVPDVMIISNRESIHEDAIYGAPDLVVEVLSPSTMRRDRTVKMKKYAAAGVREYWIVTPGTKSIEVYLNQDGTFELDEVYVDFTELELKAMDEEERQAVKWQIKVSLYDDLFVDVKEIFEKV